MTMLENFEILLRGLGIAIPGGEENLCLRKPLLTTSNKKGWMISRSKRRLYRPSSKVRKEARQIGGGLGAHLNTMTAGPSKAVVPQGM